MAIPPFSRKSTAAAIASVALSAASAAALAEDIRNPLWFTATYGNGQRVDLYGIGAMWRPSWGPERFAQRGFEWRVAADLNYWVGHTSATNDRTLWDLGLTPFIRWNAATESFKSLFIEAGIGPHLLSRTRIGVGGEHWRNFSTAFHFGSRLAVGVKLGDKAQYELAGFVQHDSNGGIKLPNDGLTYFGVTLRLPLELR